MKRIASILIGLSILFGSTLGFGKAPAQQDQPKAEKKGDKKGAKKGDKAKQQSGKRKTEQPKAQ